MHLGWLHEARGEQSYAALKKDTWEMGHVLNITEGIQIEKRDMPILRAKERIRTHVEHIAQTMEYQQDMARYFLHRVMENARVLRNPWVEMQLDMGSVYKVVKE